MGEKPEAKSQGHTYPYPTNAVILSLGLYPSTPTVPPAWNGSAPKVSGRSETAFRLLARSYTSTGAEMEWQTMWGLWNPVMGALCTPLRATPIMPANSSVMPWGIGEYWDTGPIHKIETGKMTSSVFVFYINVFNSKCI